MLQPGATSFHLPTQLTKIPDITSAPAATGKEAIDWQERRRVQNRKSQRAWRERREKEIELLKCQIKNLQEKHQNLQDEHQNLLQLCTRQANEITMLNGIIPE